MNRRSARHAAGFGSTYEGLKPILDWLVKLFQNSFGSTYEGLKLRERVSRLLAWFPSFGSTYEGLKRS